MRPGAALSESLLGEHWTRASNIVVRKSDVRTDDGLRSDALDFQVPQAPQVPQVPQVPQASLETPRRSSRRISSLREKSEQDLQQLQQLQRRASQFGGSGSKRRGAPKASKESKNQKMMLKVSSMLKECLEVAKFRLAHHANKVNLVKLQLFNQRKGKANGSDPELLHLAFQDAMHEARSIQQQAVTAKNEVKRLQAAVQAQKARLVQLRRR